MGQHAFLSPSAAHRWMHCTAAPELEIHEPDQSSVFAEEGTLAHAIGEAKLREYLSGGQKLAEAYYKENEQTDDDWTKHELYLPEMEEYTDYYRDCVINILEDARKTTPDAKLLIEQRLDYSEYLYGTTDAMIIADGELNVIDYKHGKGVKVSAENNPQMMIYALAAYLEHGDFYAIKTVRMTIIQPRLANVSHWSISIEDLNTWHRDTLVPAIEKALGKKTASQEAGSWCKFCKVRGKCAALAAMAEGTAMACDDPRLLSLEEVGRILPKVDTIKAWCEDLQAYALESLLQGGKVPGYKVVEGRSKRVIPNPDKLAKVLTENGYTGIYKPQELLTLTSLEKIVGKKQFANLCSDLIARPKGKPSLAEASDKRPEWQSPDSDFADIINNI